MRRQMVTCDGCGMTLRKKIAVHTAFKADGSRFTEKGQEVKKYLCGDCMRAGELPPEITLVRSSWAPWGEMPVTPIGELLYIWGKKNKCQENKKTA